MSFQTQLNNQDFNYKKQLNFLSIGFFGFKRFFEIQKFKTKLLFIVFLAIFMGIINFFIIEKTGIYVPGINAINQSIARLFKKFSPSSINEELKNIIYSLLFWGLSSIFNLFFAIFCYKKIGKNFTILTCIYIFIISITGLVLSNLPENWGLKYFYIFSNPNLITSNKINLVTWNINFPSNTNASSTNQFIISNPQIIIIFLYGFFYAISSTFVSLIIYSMSSGTGGIDWIVFYLYKKKQYCSNKLFFYLGLIISFCAYVLGTYIPYLIEAKDKPLKETLPNLFSPTFLATLIIIFTKKLLLHFFYPQFKFVSVKVFTNKFLEIRNLLLEKNFNHSFTITKSFGSFQLQQQTQLEFICFSIESHKLIKYIRKIAPNDLIIATSIKSLNGYIKNNKNLN